MPLKNVLCGKFRQAVGEIFMVHMDPNRGTQENGMKLFKSFNNGEKLFFDGGIIMLGGIRFSGIVSNGAALLFDNKGQVDIHWHPFPHGRAKSGRERPGEHRRGPVLSYAQKLVDGLASRQSYVCQ